MIVFRVSPSGREEVAEMVRYSTAFREAEVRLADGTIRWIPADWVIEEVPA